MAAIDHVIGLMSGTSLDGLDICLASFSEIDGKLIGKIENAITLPYSAEWVTKLKKAEHCVGAELAALHDEYGIYLGKCVNDFVKEYCAGKKITLVSSHGHTIYHAPTAGYTFQLGSGISLRKTGGIPVACDFRSGDVALGGQGAPLVPIGDRLLFGEYEYCLNIGGFANISFEQDGKRIAYDICAANYVLNRLTEREGKKYDDGGRMAEGGKIIPALLEKLNALPYYSKPHPKSLGREWAEQNIFPLFPNENSTADLLRTFTEHIAMQIAKETSCPGKMLVTGGGAHNSFLISRMKELCKAEIVIPEKNIVDFKEAYIFALLGYLRMKNRINILSSVTGASKDSSGGTICK